MTDISAEEKVAAFEEAILGKAKLYFDLVTENVTNNFDKALFFHSRLEALNNLLVDYKLNGCFENTVLEVNNLLNKSWDLVHPERVIG